MKNLWLLCLLSLVSLSTYARKPAVEDFIGVEPESYKTTPPGTEVLYNFEQNVQAFGQDNFNPQESFQSPWIGVFAIGAFIFLPALMWFGMTRNTPQPDSIQETSAESTPSGNNVHVLEDYRSPEDSPEDDSKKAS